MKEVFIKTMLGWKKLVVWDGALLHPEDQLTDLDWIHILHAEEERRAEASWRRILGSVSKRSHQDCTAENAGGAIEPKIRR